MYQIVYLSSATRPFSEQDLNNLLEECHFNNTQNRITGILVYLDASIIQLIEGDEYEVQRIFRKIQADDRHKGIITLYSGKAQERLFPNWSMAYKMLSQSEFVEGLGVQVDLNEKDLLPQFESQDAKGMKLLRSFYIANQGIY
ncbi:MAG: BLUF domain-containing protein [Bacteroidia bacterium]